MLPKEGKCVFRADPGSKISGKLSIADLKGTRSRRKKGPLRLSLSGACKTQSNNGPQKRLRHSAVVAE